MADVSPEDLAKVINEGGYEDQPANPKIVTNPDAYERPQQPDRILRPDLPVDPTPEVPEARRLKTVQSAELMRILIREYPCEHCGGEQHDNLYAFQTENAIFRAFCPRTGSPLFFALSGFSVDRRNLARIAELEGQLSARKADNVSFAQDLQRLQDAVNELINSSYSTGDGEVVSSASMHHLTNVLNEVSGG